MIKFFRHIRKSLLMENKAGSSGHLSRSGKYFKYAIGEILLVVIGILIALQINNWNENRKQDILTNSYYNQILNDFERENVYLANLIDDLKKNNSSYDTYMKSFDNSNLKVSDFISFISQVEYTSHYLEFNTNTIETLQNTGEIKFIPEEIRNKVVELKRAQERITRVANGNNEVYLNSFMKAVEQGYSLIYQRAQNHPEVIKELDKEINSTKVLLTAEAALSMKYFSETLLVAKLNEMLIDIKEIQVLINDELN